MIIINIKFIILIIMILINIIVTKFIKAESSLMDAICSVTREKEEKLLLLVQVMVISMITMMMVIYSHY